jgi:hypothetical protein
MKKILLHLFISFFALISMTLPQTVSAAPTAETMDQACPNIYPYLPNVEMVNTGRHLTAQFFSPTKNTLDAVIVLLKNLGGRGAKASVQVINLTTPEIAGVIAEKNIAVTSTTQNGGWLIVDFDDVPMPRGVYSLVVKSLHPEQPAGWLKVDANCYQYGYAKVDGNTEINSDFAFAVYGYDSTNPPAASSTDDDQSIDEQVSKALNETNTDQTSTNSNPDSALNQGDQILDPDSKESLRVSSTAGVNSASSHGERLMADEDYRAMIDDIMADFEAKKPKGKEKYLQIAGMIFSSPLFMLAGSLFFIVLVIVVIAIIIGKRRKTPPEITNATEKK